MLKLHDLKMCSNEAFARKIRFYLKMPIDYENILILYRERFVPTQVVTLTQIVTGDSLGLTPVITMVPADPSGNFLPQIRYTH